MENLLISIYDLNFFWKHFWPKIYWFWVKHVFGESSCLLSTRPIYSKIVSGWHHQRSVPDSRTRQKLRIEGWILSVTAMMIRWTEPWPLVHYTRDVSSSRQQSFQTGAALVSPPPLRNWHFLLSFIFQTRGIQVAIFLKQSREDFVKQAIIHPFIYLVTHLSPI